ncbi:hypothetical protein EVA_19789 [gut metagenome]|uniref:Uncharacterized protein n=1 Tax=gut metagenome TaxID=749906 RepID=J9FXN9_9ZZZZ
MFSLFFLDNPSNLRSPFILQTFLRNRVIIFNLTHQGIFYI